MLSFETLIDTTLIEAVIKSATNRARPLEGDGNGGFGDGAHGVLKLQLPFQPRDQHLRYRVGFRP